MNFFVSLPLSIYLYIHMLSYIYYHIYLSLPLTRWESTNSASHPGLEVVTEKWSGERATTHTYMYVHKI